MTIGGSIALIILGAVLAFAVTYELSGIDINVIGVILMIGGAVGVVVGLILRQRRAATTTHVDNDDPEF